MKAIYVYTGKEINDPIDLLDAVEEGQYADTPERAKELASDPRGVPEVDVVYLRPTKVYKLSCEEVS